MASGSQNNTTYQAQKWTNLRAFTIGDTAKNVDGTAAVSWSKDEILGASTDAYFLRGDKNWSNELSANFSAGSYITAGTYISAGSYITADTFLQAGNHIYLDAGHLYMKYNDERYAVLHNYNNGNIGVNATGTGVYIGYSNTTLVNWMNGRMQLKNGCLSIFPNNSSYREGIRIHSTGSWSDITLCGNDNTGDSGTSANSWFIGNNNGNFYISRNGSSSSSSAILSCVSNVWAWNGTADGNISGNAATVTTAADTSNDLNPLGVTSGATTTIKRNTSITMNGGTLTASRLIATSMTDSTGDATNAVALITGTAEGEHIEYDSNEIQAKHNSTTVNNLSLNYAGGNVVLGINNATYNVTIRSTADSTNKSTGALVVGGGVGIGGRLCAAGNIWAGTAGDTTEERDVGVRSGAGTLYLYSTASATGSRGLYTPAHGTGEGKAIVAIDTNNVASFNGNASTATALTSNAGGTEQPIYFTGGKPAATTYALKATVNNGTASRIAYYSTARAIDSGSIVTDGGYLGNVDYLSINKAHQTSYRLWVQGTIMTTGNHVLRHETYDSTSATNGISEAISRGWFFQDKNGRDITRMLGYAQTNGNTRLYLQVRNYDVDTVRDYAGIVLIMDKEGTITYTVSSPANFRSAIGVGASGTHADSYFVKTSGDTMSGALTVSRTTYNDGGSYIKLTSNSKSLGLHVGSGGTNRGVYDWTAGEWLCYYDSSNNGHFVGNASTATKLANSRTISLTGSVTGSGSFDGSGNLSIATTTNHDHTHIVQHASFAKGTKPSSTTYLLGSWGCETGTGTATTNRFFGLEGNVNASGRSVMYLIAYQNTADSTASNTFAVWMDQDGTRGYSVSDAAAFRSAIGAGTSSLTIGTTATTAAAGNHNHNSVYVNVSGDTMTGTLNSNTILPETTSTSTSTGYDLGSNTKRYRAMYLNQGIFVGPQGYTSSSTAYNGSTMGSSTFHSTRTTAGGGYYVRDADVVVGRFWYQTEGTTDVEGKGTIQLGNNLATGTDQNASGRIRMYGSNTGYTDIDAKYGTVAGDANKTYLTVGYLSTTKVTNAVWNDYAECRVSDYNTPGRVVLESNNGRMQLANDRLLPGCKIISDTFGNLMGESETAKTPIAVAGRVLVYPYQDRDKYELGAAVCSAPNGTVDIMTREEIREYPERIIGTVSEIPTYDVWQAGSKEDPVDVQVNGRIWIYVR